MKKIKHFFVCLTLLLLLTSTIQVTQTSSSTISPLTDKEDTVITN